MIFVVLGIPDSVEEMCPGMPRLDGLMKDINDMAESGARYTEMPHVIEVVLPMLCNYLSYWWERGPENQPASGGIVFCTTVTSEHLSLILGNILKILNNNLGIDEASWMKRIAGDHEFPHSLPHPDSFLKYVAVYVEYRTDRQQSGLIWQFSNNYHVFFFLLCCFN